MRDEFFDEHWHVLWEALSYEVLDAAVSGTIRCMLALLCPPYPTLPYPTLPYPTLPRWGNSTAEARPGHRSMRCAVGLGELRRARSSRDSSFGTVLQSNCVRTRTSRMQRTKSGTIASASRSEGIPDPDKLPAWRSSHPPDQILEVNSIAKLRTSWKSLQVVAAEPRAYASPVAPSIRCVCDIYSSLAILFCIKDGIWNVRPKHSGGARASCSGIQGSLY